jgi:hypothetical protein
MCDTHSHVLCGGSYREGGAIMYLDAPVYMYGASRYIMRILQGGGGAGAPAVRNGGIDTVVLMCVE